MDYKRRIFGFECDIYGHLNNANYLHIYEEARAIALEEIGFPIRKFRDMGIHIYLTKIELTYKKAVLLEDNVSVQTEIVESNRLKSTWVQNIFNSQNILCNQAIVNGVFIKEGKPYRLPKDLYEKMKTDRKN